MSYTYNRGVYSYVRTADTSHHADVLKLLRQIANYNVPAETREAAAQVALDALMEMPPEPKVSKVIADLKRAMAMPVSKGGPDLKDLKKMREERNRVRAMVGAAEEGIDLLEDTKKVEPFDEAVMYFDEYLKRIGKQDRAWWDPNHNLIVNSTLLGGLNLWYFMILPNFRAPYYIATDTSIPRNIGKDGKPLEGLILDFSWNSLHSGQTIDASLESAEVLVKNVRKAPSITESVKRQLGDIEEKFSMKIPPAIEAKIVADAPKIAARRWGTNGLRRKALNIPFDGTKPFEV